MPDSIWIDGRHEWVENAEAFAQILEEKLGRDAADLFRSYLKLGCSESTKSYIEEALDLLRNITDVDDYSLDDVIEILEELIL